ncbi:hypothetical protein LTR91_005627 [Friedmanniomyces endolithicus]|uniref:Cyanovirin-N domain-containing protein n=1 Tax=Friedmanniomyces endolithicus TaxID=329885 RepID=A0AAN6KUZ2_9PEZI|nr:hypothetical protein LTR57_015910 [Friedmanniomyces endolithicus]KAK0969500.1 hypothetical protein LTS01_016248 [Friedmanniomyces endolithicus]KAK1000709.1 hypothetical protein LTR91_005627 [Friedmanniomyces endolithicus]KAK1049728.1 hypothetical protein LTS16_003611 [Friedmanniomyces endolithicus]
MPSRQTPILTVTAFFMLASLCKAQCPGGYLGIGLNQVCIVNTGGQNVCGATSGIVWDSNCNQDALADNGFCNGGFNNGYSINCASAGQDEQVGGVTDGDGTVYGNCIDAGSLGVTNCGNAPDQVNSICYCCRQ